MALSIKDLKGITADMVAKLQARGVHTTDEFLAAAGTESRRKELADIAGADTKAILELANRADLARIKGVAGVFSDLLEQAGVDTVVELSKRKPENLHEKLVAVNKEMKISHRDPRAEEVEDWVAQAKSLPRAIEY